MAQRTNGHKRVSKQQVKMVATSDYLIALDRLPKSGGHPVDREKCLAEVRQKHAGQWIGRWDVREEGQIVCIEVVATGTSFRDVEDQVVARHGCDALADVTIEHVFTGPLNPFTFSRSS